MTTLQLEPKEQLIESFQIQYMRNKQLIQLTLSITNLRISLSLDPICNFPLFDLEYVHAPQQYNAPPIFATKIQTKDNSKVVRFVDKSQQDLFSKYIDLLKIQKNELTCLKYKILAENESIKQLYDMLVMEGIQDEDEFWSKNEIIRNYKFLSQGIDQNIAKVVKSYQYNSNGLTQDMKIELLRREPLLRNRFNKKVGGEQKFWDDFLQEQIQRETIVVGGINRIYLGSEEMESLFVQSQQVQNNSDSEIDLCMEQDDFDIFEEGQRHLLEKDQGMNKIKKIIKSYNERCERVVENMQHDRVGINLETNDQGIFLMNMSKPTKSNQMEIEQNCIQIPNKIKLNYFKHNVFDPEIKNIIMEKEREEINKCNQIIQNQLWK